MSAPDVVPVARIGDVQLAYLQSGADRFCVVSNVPGHGNALYSQATIDALQARIEKLEKVYLAAMEWSSEHSPKTSQDAELMKALWRNDGDRVDPCPECDGDCGEPCAPITADQAIAGIDRYMAKLTADAAIKANP